MVLVFQVKMSKLAIAIGYHFFTNKIFLKKLVGKSTPVLIEKDLASSTSLKAFYVAEKNLPRNFIH